jgi:hypothetical protein
LPGESAKRVFALDGLVPEAELLKSACDQFHFRTGAMTESAKKHLLFSMIDA